MPDKDSSKPTEQQPQPQSSQPKVPDQPQQPAVVEKKERDYTFNYSWPLVVKAFWDKYPNPNMDFVKYNKLIGMEMLDDGKIRMKRVQYTQKWSFLWAYVIEEITIDPKNQVMEMQSKILKKSDLIPVLGNEYISYRAANDLKDQVNKTIYSKRLELEGTINKAINSFSDGFSKGIKIVEDNCETLKSMTTEEWVRKLSLIK